MSQFHLGWTHLFSKNVPNLWKYFKLLYWNFPILDEFISSISVSSVHKVTFKTFICRITGCCCANKNTNTEWRIIRDRDPIYLIMITLQLFMNTGWLLPPIQATTNLTLLSECAMESLSAQPYPCTISRPSTRPPRPAFSQLHNRDTIAPLSITP